jgi:hypothetical protein
MPIGYIATLKESDISGSRLRWFWFKVVEDDFKVFIYLG